MEDNFVHDAHAHFGDNQFLRENDIRHGSESHQRRRESSAGDGVVLVNDRLLHVTLDALQHSAL